MKHKPQTILIIAAVAVMLAAPTSTVAYNETWNGWFNSGSITYYTEVFDYTSGQGMLDDVTVGSVDTFLITTAHSSTFTCESGRYEGYYIVLWHNNAHGWKYTGQSGQKEAHNGTWTGNAILYDPESEPADDLDVWGTWDTDDANDDFDYSPHTPAYSAHWEITGSDDDALEGEGGSAGTLQ